MAKFRNVLKKIVDYLLVARFEACPTLKWPPCTVRPRFVPPRKVPTSQECHFETRPKILAICYFPRTVPFFHEKETKNFKLIPFMNPCHFWNLQIHSCKIGTKLLLLCHCLNFFCSKIWIESKVLMLYFWKLCFWSNRFLQSWHETCTF